MKFKEIQELHSKLDERMNNRDTQRDDVSLALMADSEGWRVLNDVAQKMIAELLESPEFSDETPLDVRGAIHEARSFGIDVLRKLIGNVESTRLAKKIEKIDEPKQAQD